MPDVVPDVVSDVLYPMLRPMCCARFTPVCVEGRCPYFDILPLQGANVIKPSRGGRVSFTPFTIPWAEIPLPLQGAAVLKPPNANRIFATHFFCHHGLNLL